MTETRKLYYSISEVSERLGVKPHVLRYWESQFRWLRPKKNRAGNRSYQEKDLVLLDEIRVLLYDRRFTIEGARKELDRRRAAGDHLERKGGGDGETVGERVDAPTAATDRAGAQGPPDSPRSGAPAGSAPASAAEPPSPPGEGAASRQKRLGELRAELTGLKEWLERRS